MNHIEREHPLYAAQKDTWRQYNDLYAGGEKLRQNASTYLHRRNKEPLQVYGERLDRVFYENYIGSIIDWYGATLLRREPVLIYEGSNEAAKRFFAGFADDCDLKGTSLSDFFRRQLVSTLIYGKTYVAVDFPRPTTQAMTRAEEDALGQSRAYLLEYSPQDIINWSHDSRGNLNWVVIRTTCQQQESVTDPTCKPHTRWVYYDKQRYQIFEHSTSNDGTGEMTLMDQGYHALAALNRVPLFQLKVSEGLWLMNKAALLQLEHFNKSNALSWALTMGLFASPVIYSEREWNQIVGESYYIQLGPGDKFGWAEPEGKVYQIAADNLVRLKDEIYRVCYLMSQAGSSQAMNVSQSGLSKQRDFSITQEVLRAYGDAAKDTMRQVLRAIEAARQDGLVIDVSGLDEFDIGDFSTELDDAKKLLDLGIDSLTLKKQLFKRLAYKYFCDVRQEVKDQIAREIDQSFEKSGN